MGSRRKAGFHLVIDSNNLIAFVTLAAELGLVTLDAVCVFILGYITLTDETFITLPTIEVRRVPILVHCTGCFVTEDELETKRW